MNYCSHCGHKLDRADYTLCPECGARLSFSGSGFGLTFGSEIIKCKYCNGTGMVSTGKIFSAWNKRCPVCEGKGVTRV